MAERTEWYAYGDRRLELLKKQQHSLFVKARLMDFDEINAKVQASKVLTRIKALYKKLKKLNEDYFEDLWLYCYTVAFREVRPKTDRNRPPLDSDKTFMALLKGYNPVTKYVYDNEVDRKCSRLFEAIVSDKEVHNRHAVEMDYGTAERLFLAMTHQYFIDVEDHARKTAYKNAGVERVRWVSVEDERRCRDCKELDGQIFDIDKVPPKPHLNCRCKLVPVLGE